jgi:glycosyltransferase involved in cell wall biosynthesis
MELALTVVFWCSICVVVYAYAGYPAILTLVARLRARRDIPAATEPSVSVVISAYNEERWLADKVRNVLAQDYPADRLEVVIVSDGSTDRTEAIAQGLEGARVRLLVQPRRGGKNLALNRGAAVATGDVLVFTDANAMLAPGALRRLVAPFADPQIGLVSGQGLYGELGDGAARVVSNAYVRYEAFIKTREALLGFVAAADGALYAIRRELFSPLPSDQVHDLVHPIQTITAGRRCFFAADAFTVEPPSPSAGREFERHVRIIAQGLLVFFRQAPLLGRLGHLAALWMLVSHRFARWISSFFLVTAFVANIPLAGVGRLYAATMIAQVLFYALAAAGAVAERLGVRVRLLALPYYFCVVSAAGAAGFLQFSRGRGHVVWASAGERA